MDHREFVASLSAGQRQRLTEKSDRAGLMHLALHWGAIVVVGGLILAGVPGWPVLMIVQGILIIFLFTLLHETVHQTPFRSPYLNTVAGYVSGFAIGLAPYWFRFFHLAHHRYTHDPEKDPELAEAKPETVGQYIVYVSGLPVWFSHVRTLIRNAMGRCDDPFVPKGKRDRVRREARIMALCYAAIAATCIAFGNGGLLYVWILPAFLGQPFLRLYLLAEHTRCPHVANMFENTRTTFTARLVRQLAWNMPYHAEHHAYPTVPFHRLPELHRLTREHLRETERGYVRFHRKYVSDLSG